MWLYILCVVPGSVDGLRILSTASKFALISWSPLDCGQRNGPTEGYLYELIQQSSENNVETSHIDRTSHAGGTVVFHQLTNDTQVNLTRLLPLTRYTLSVSFRNVEFEGPKTFVNFTTNEDGSFVAYYVFIYLYL